MARGGAGHLCRGAAGHEPSGITISIKIRTESPLQMTPWLHLSSPPAAPRPCGDPDHNILVPAAGCCRVSFTLRASDCFPSVETQSGAERAVTSGWRQAPVIAPRARAGWSPHYVSHECRVSDKQLNQSAINNAANTRTSSQAPPSPDLQLWSKTPKHPGPRTRGRHR